MKTIISSILKNKLLTRTVVTIGILFLIRMGTFVPVPGIDRLDLIYYFRGNPVAKNLVSTFSGDKTFMIGVFTLNIFPLINATIFVQLLVAFSPQLAKLQKEGDFQSRRQISRYTRFGTLMVAIGQSIGIALYLRPILFDWNVILASEIVIWLTTGTMIVVWLSELITDYGIGNGASLLIYLNIVSNIGNKLLLKDSEASISFSTLSILVLIGIIIVSLYGIVFLQTTNLNLRLISAKQLNQSSFQDRSNNNNYLPLRFNQAGVMPIILATSFLVVPNYLINLGLFPELTFLTNFIFFKPIYWIGYFVLILTFSSFYSSITLNPKDLSDQLQKMAVTIQGVRPGIKTIFYLKRELGRMASIGGCLLAIIAILPNFIESTFHLTVFNGLSTTSFLILAGVILDLERQIKDFRS